MVAILVASNPLASLFITMFLADALYLPGSLSVTLCSLLDVVEAGFPLTISAGSSFCILNSSLKGTRNAIKCTSWAIVNAVPNPLVYAAVVLSGILAI